MPTVIDLSEKSLECLKPKIAACNITAIIVAKEVEENNFSIQFSKKPLSNNSSNIDSSRIKGMMRKKCNQFPFRLPNLETALSDEVSAPKEKGKRSIKILKATSEIIVAVRIKAATPNVFHKLSGFLNPKSFHVIFRTFILHTAIIKVENDHINPFGIKDS